jgi:hypothetical protein
MTGVVDDIWEKLYGPPCYMGSSDRLKREPARPVWNNPKISIKPSFRGVSVFDIPAYGFAGHLGKCISAVVANWC